MSSVTSTLGIIEFRIIGISICENHKVIFYQIVIILDETVLYTKYIFM